jgi:hypothetical protein
MCLDDNIFNILWKHVEQFKMNIMSTKYSKLRLSTIINVFAIFSIFEQLEIY